MNDQYLYLRPAIEQDLELIHSWRCTPSIYSITDNSQEPPSWEETRRWWNAMPNGIVLMAMLVETTPLPIYWNGRRIGMMWSNDESEIPLFNVIIGEVELFGTEMAAKIYQFAVEDMKKIVGKRPLRTLVKENNPILKKLVDKGWSLNKQVDGFCELMVK